MKLNVGSLDRILRMAECLLLLAFALGLVFPNTGWNRVGWIGIVLLLTAAFRYCPSYSLIGIRTGH